MRKYKSEHNLSMRAEMDELQVECDLKHIDWFKQTEMDLKLFANAKKVSFAKNARLS
jgi:valyl-tRNA synthetase